MEAGKAYMEFCGPWQEYILSRAATESGSEVLVISLQVYVYYELGKYYQNHKRYVRSRDDNQMAGKGTGSGKCAPEQYVGGNPNPALPQDGAITPCGLIAWSFFNDSFGDAASLAGPGGAPTPVTLDVGSAPVSQLLERSV